MHPLLESLAGGKYSTAEGEGGGAGQEEVWGRGCLSCEDHVTSAQSQALIDGKLDESLGPRLHVTQILIQTISYT